VGGVDDWNDEMTDITWTNIKVRLGDLKPWDQNPRTSSKAQAKRILASFEKYGQVAPIAIDPANNVLDGHQRLSALLTVHGAGYEVEARQSSRPLSDDERRGLVLALANATGSWNWDLLSSWSSADLNVWGFDAETLAGWNNDANNLKEMLQAEEETKPAAEDTGINVTNQYGVIVICDSEAHQEAVYNELLGAGYKVKVVVV
jgi:hypothetical protein